jgi:hypothetical protein
VEAQQQEQVVAHPEAHAAPHLQLHLVRARGPVLWAKQRRHLSQRSALTSRATQRTNESSAPNSRVHVHK